METQVQSHGRSLSISHTLVLRRSLFQSRGDLEKIVEFPTEQKYDLDHTVVAYVRDNLINDGSELNQSIQKTMDGERPTKWRGPMLAFSLPGTSGDPPFFQHFNLADIRVVADFLRVYDGLDRRDTGNRFVSEFVNSSTSERTGRFHRLWIVGFKSLILTSLILWSRHVSASNHNSSLHKIAH
jgi:hypothetical protein